MLLNCSELATKLALVATVDPLILKTIQQMPLYKACQNFDHETGVNCSQNYNETLKKRQSFQTNTCFDFSGIK
jgi:hypothetical protein